MSNGTFEDVDMNGEPFWIDFDGAEGIGFWVGDPESGSQPLSLGVSERMVQWFWSMRTGVELEVPAQTHVPYLDHN